MTFPTLRLLYVGGEPVYRRDVELYKTHFSHDCVFVNRLGTTEAGMIGYYIVDKNTPITGDIVPVRHDLDGIEVRVLDEAGREVHCHGIGEIVVKSRYLALGYWRRPELTQAAFHPDPAGGPIRLYRTGDLGRLLPNGRLEHQGRKDFRAKIRGHRIDLGEIEEALLDHTAIQESVVVLREDRSGDQRLIAYLVPAQHPGPTGTVLRGLLRERLPDYMQPTAFVMLDALPLMPGGKIDRQALPVPDTISAESPTPVVVAPRTPVEQALVRLWAEVLGLDQVGIHDDFLELGGNSLLATQMVARIRSTFHVEIPYRPLIEASTVARMAVVIVQHLLLATGCEDIEHILRSS